MIDIPARDSKGKFLPVDERVLNVDAVEKAAFRITITTTDLVEIVWCLKRSEEGTTPSFANRHRQRLIRVLERALGK